MTAAVLENLALLAASPSGIECLSALILDLATRGLLSAAEQPRTRDMSLPNDDMGSFAIPSDWRWVRLGELCSLITSGSRGWKEFYAERGAIFIRSQDIKHDRLEFDQRAFVALPANAEGARTHVQQHDLLITITGANVGKAAYLAESIDEAYVSQHVALVRLRQPLQAPYVHRWLINELGGRKQLLASSYGAKPGLNLQNIKDLPVPLPPLAEQHRIVAKVDELMALCDRLEARQQDAEAAHTRLVQALLDSLTQARDADEFETSWQRVAAQFEPLFISEDSVAALRQAVIDCATTGRFQQGAVSEAWRDGHLGDLVVDSGSGWSPSCEARQRADGEWGVLKVSAVSWGNFLPDENKALPASLTARPELEVRPGDFLISRANTADLVARSVFVEATPPKLMMSDKIVRLRFSDACEPRFAQLSNSSTAARRYYAEVAGGTSSSMKNVTRAQILALPIRYPSQAEQRRIVAKVTELLTLCDQLKARLAAARARQTQLAEALVAQAVAA